MKVFHTFRIRPNHELQMKDFEIFTLILSALEWRKHNGYISLITDKQGVSFVLEYGISDIWDSIDVCLDDMVELGIDENTFWAGAKLYALSRQQAPCIMIDLDFIVWKKVDFSIYGTDIAVIHRESVGNDIYPSKEHFHFKDGRWALPNDLDWSQEACNTAFAYFGDKALMDMYLKLAFDFMRQADIRNAGLPYMVFAEQWLISMCAVKMNKRIYTFSTLSKLFNQKQNCYTHLWGYKEILRQDNDVANQFCRQCAERLGHDFPQWAERLKFYRWAKRYL